MTVAHPYHSGHTVYRVISPQYCNALSLHTKAVLDLITMSYASRDTSTLPYARSLVAPTDSYPNATASGGWDGFGAYRSASPAPKAMASTGDRWTSAQSDTSAFRKSTGGVSQQRAPANAPTRVSNHDYNWTFEDKETLLKEVMRYYVKNGQYVDIPVKDWEMIANKLIAKRAPQTVQGYWKSGILGDNDESRRNQLALGIEILSRGQNRRIRWRRVTSVDPYFALPNEAQTYNESRRPSGNSSQHDERPGQTYNQEIGDQFSTSLQDGWRQPGNYPVAYDDPDLLDQHQEMLSQVHRPQPWSPAPPLAPYNGAYPPLGGSGAGTSMYRSRSRDPMAAIGASRTPTPSKSFAFWNSTDASSQKWLPANVPPPRSSRGIDIYSALDDQRTTSGASRSYSPSNIIDGLFRKPPSPSHAPIRYQTEPRPLSAASNDTRGRQTPSHSLPPLPSGSNAWGYTASLPTRSRSRASNHRPSRPGSSLSMRGSLAKYRPGRRQSLHGDFEKLSLGDDSVDRDEKTDEERERKGSDGRESEDLAA